MKEIPDEMVLSEDLATLRMFLRSMSEALLMIDAYEAGECGYNSSLWDRALEIANIFRPKK